MAASKTILESCSLTDVRLIESSSKLFLPDITPGVPVTVHFSHEIAFAPTPEKDSIDFYIDLTSKLLATFEEDEKEFFTATGK